MRLTYNDHPLRIITWKGKRHSQALWHYRVEYLKNEKWVLWFEDVDFGLTRWEAKRKAKSVIRIRLGLGEREEKVTYL